MAERKHHPSPVLPATVAAAALVAQQVIGKATRDALFLSHFPVAKLPLLLILGSVVSVAVALLTARWVARFGPGRVAPIAFAAHGVLVLGEWGLASRFEAQIALIFYVQTVASGATLVSAFWSVIGESFDPHSAKRLVGRIGAGAALGGVVGGAIAWRASQVTTLPTLLGVLGALSGIAAWGTATLARRTPTSATPLAETHPQASGFGALRQARYLQLLGCSVLFSAMTQALLDYALGAEATRVYGSGARLLAFFATFQTAISTLAFLTQLSVNRWALERLGVGATLAALPAAVVTFGALVLGAPSLVSVALQRGSEGVLRASLFRSAYEVLYTPLTAASKRPTKLLIDVGFDRVGLMLGSALTLGLVALLPQHALRAVSVAALVAAAIQLIIAHGLQRGYVVELANRLRTGRLVLDPANVVDATTRRTLSETLQSLDRSTLLEQIAALRATGATSTNATAAFSEFADVADGAAQPVDGVVATLTLLRSDDAAMIVRGLQRPSSELLPLVLPLLDLLGRDDVAREAERALAPLASRSIGSIMDVVLDAQRPACVRRRAARLLQTQASPRAAAALCEALDVAAFDVRYTCGRVLLALREKNPELSFDADVTLARVRRELSADTKRSAPVARRLEHAFALLSLTLPYEPLQLAYGAALGPDPFLRGVALEYLESVLPADLRVALTSLLQKTPERTRSAPHPNRQPLDELLLSKSAIQLNLDELRGTLDPDLDIPK